MSTTTPESGAQYGFTIGSLIDNRYEICGRLGTGGAGVVFKVIDHKLNGEMVALKIIKANAQEDERLYRRLVNEVIFARSLTHPNIVRIHDIGETQQSFSYVSMEYVAGKSLAQLLVNKVGHTLQFDDIVAKLCEILHGVAYAHEKGIIHRDLKPANILLNEAGEVKVADFGLARSVMFDAGVTGTGETVGTPAYMSPEQIRGEELDNRTDIYSLGIVGYQLASGNLPYSSGSFLELAMMHLHEPIPPFSDTCCAPAWFQDAVFKATEKEREDRFQSAEEFVECLRRGKAPSEKRGSRTPTRSLQAVHMRTPLVVNSSSPAPAEFDTFDSITLHRGSSLARTMLWMAIGVAVLSLAAIAFVMLTRMRGDRQAQQAQVAVPQTVVVKPQFTVRAPQQYPDLGKLGQNQQNGGFLSGAGTQNFGSTQGSNSPNSASSSWKPPPIVGNQPQIKRYLERRWREKNVDSNRVAP